MDTTKLDDRVDEKVDRTVEEPAFDLSLTASKPRQRRAYFRLPAILFLVVAGGIFWWGDRRTAPDLTRPLILQGEVKHESLPREWIKVASFNIHGGKGRDGKVDLSRTAACLEKFDIVGLTEVRSQDYGFGETQAATIAGELDMAWAFSGTEKRWWHEHFGNALLTKVALNSLHRIPLPGTQDKRFRNAILTSFRHQKQRVNVLTVHIDRDHDRKEQLIAVVDLFNALDGPTILMGDFNSYPRDKRIQRMFEEPGVVNCIGEKLGKDDPRWRLDWIITRGFRCRNAGMLENEASDHPMVWATLELLPGEISNVE